MMEDVLVTDCGSCAIINNILLPVKGVRRKGAA